jgi:hypothetical protein
MIINISIYDDDQPFYLLLSFMINHDPSWLILDNLQNGSFWLGESVQSLMANVAGSCWKMVLSIQPVNHVDPIISIWWILNFLKWLEYP